MPFVTNKQLMTKAMEGKFALGAFNVNNMELIQGISWAAKELDAPLILQISKGARDYAGRTYIMKLIEAAEKETGLEQKHFKKQCPFTLKQMLHQKFFPET